MNVVKPIMNYPIFQGQYSTQFQQPLLGLIGLKPGLTLSPNWIIPW